MNNRNKATAMDSVVELSPKVKRGRSTFNLGIKDYTSFNVGDLVPLGGFTEVLPGDTFNVNLDTFIRMTSSSKRAPMDNLHMDVFAFFVPYRFLDAGWVNIQGENPQAWVAPSKSCSVFRLYNDAIQAGSLLNHLGLPILPASGAGTYYEFNIYPIYAYYKIVNDWFRDENLENEFAFDNTNGVYSLISIPQINGKYVFQSGSLFKVAKYHDVFTSALPAPQKSNNPVTVPLGKEAPIYMESDSNLTAGDPYIVAPKGNGTKAYNLSSSLFVFNSTDQTDNSNARMYVNLENATAATINQLRLAFQLQKAYELDARSGTRYTEALEARFSVKNPDLRLGRSELLGHYRFDLNMAEINSNAGAGASGATVASLKGDSYLNGVGAGSSKTGNRQHICVKSFTEHGLFMILGCVRPDLTYQQGIDKFWRKKDRWDFYEPIFSNIGEMPIMKSELYGSVINNDTVFGYQEAWYEYRYKQNNVSGILASDSNQGYDIFHYAQDFSSAPTLGQTFIKQSTAGVDRTLVFDSTAVDNFIINVQGVIKATRVMPLFSTPGLIDHF